MKSVKFDQWQLEEMLGRIKENYILNFNTSTNNIVISNPNMNNIGTTESVPKSEVKKIKPPSSSTMIPDIQLPLLVPIKTIRSNPDAQTEPIASEMSATKDSPFGANNLQFQFENTPTLPILRTKKAKEEYLCKIPSVVLYINLSLFNCNFSMK